MHLVAKFCFLSCEKVAFWRRRYKWIHGKMLFSHCENWAIKKKMMMLVWTCHAFCNLLISILLIKINVALYNLHITFLSRQQKIGFISQNFLVRSCLWKVFVFLQLVLCYFGLKPILYYSPESCALYTGEIFQRIANVYNSRVQPFFFPFFTVTNQTNRCQNHGKCTVWHLSM